MLHNTAAIVSSAAVVVGKGGGGQWHYGHCSGGQRVAPLLTSYRQGCTLRNKPNGR